MNIAQSDIMWHTIRFKYLKNIYYCNFKNYLFEIYLNLISIWENILFLKFILFLHMI